MLHLHRRNAPEILVETRPLARLSRCRGHGSVRCIVRCSLRWLQRILFGYNIILYTYETMYVRIVMCTRKGSIDFRSRRVPNDRRAGAVAVFYHVSKYTSQRCASSSWTCFFFRYISKFVYCFVILGMSKSYWKIAFPHLISNQMFDYIRLVYFFL